MLVEGEGSFFKAHKDTPRGEGMIGSLVVVFSTPHQGGSLVLRHGGNEWTFDSAAMLKEKISSIAYVAFFSDVEHEVTPVTSGFRITLTWNLYLGTKVAPTTTPRLCPALSDLTATLTAAVQNPKFLPRGGFLGFGLDFQYPVKADYVEHTPLRNILGRLKGSDAALLRSLKLAGLEPRLQILYEYDNEYERDVRFGDSSDSDETDDEGSDRDEGYQLGEPIGAFGFSGPRRSFVMSSKALDLGNRYMDEDLLQCFYKQGATFTYYYRSRRPSGVSSDQSAAILWVTTPTPTSRFLTPFLAYGNEAVLDYVYSDLILVAEVPPADKRRN